MTRPQLIERASKAPNTQTRDGFYARAAFRMYLQGEYERAIDIARRIDDSSLRLNLIEPMKFDQAGEMISRGDLDGAINVAHSLEKTELRAAILAKIGDTYLGTKKVDQAIETFSKAESLAVNSRSSIFLGSLMLGIASRLLENNQDRGMEATSAAISKINTIEGGDTGGLLHTSNGMSGRLSVQNRSWSARKDGGLSSISVVYPRFAGLIDVLSKISKIDLDNALLYARQLKWKNLSCAAQAIICRQVIENTQPIPKGPGKK